MSLWMHPENQGIISIHLSKTKVWKLGKRTFYYYALLKLGELILKLSTVVAAVAALEELQKQFMIKKRSRKSTEWYVLKLLWREKVDF